VGFEGGVVGRLIGWFTGVVLRVVHISDSHLSPRVPFSMENWSAVVRHVAKTPPDVVVHGGDITFNGADDLSDLIRARALLDRLSVRWLAIPGNHDIGDADDDSQPVTDVRRERYQSVFGEASWSVNVDGWRLIGVDVQTLLCELDAALDVWEWLADELHVEQPTVLFLHRPLRPWARGEMEKRSRYITEPTRSRLEPLLANGGVRLVASGHVHQWRSWRADGIAHVWAPSTWASLPDRIQPWIGSKLTGLVHYDLRDDGEITTTLIQPDGMAQVVSERDFVSPYPL
jgi:3',5'-cyclic AMP phosphodiesterase CpdA